MQSTTNIIDKNWKSLIKPNKLEINSNEDKTIAKVVAEPLEKGFGQTIGNSLRRILLSSIQGAAVTAIQIDGVLHEFSSIKGVREDVTDIVLNVKNLAIKSSSSSPKKIILDIKGPKEVKAKDITLVPEVEILNPFAGILGEDLNIIFNSIAKDKKKALDELDFSIEYFDQLDVINTKKKIKFLKKKPKNFSFSYKTSSDYFDFYLFWAGLITLVPLFWYTKGFELIGIGPASMIFFLTPTAQFLLGLYYYNEPLNIDKLISFVLIWIAVTIYLNELRKE